MRHSKLEHETLAGFYFALPNYATRHALASDRFLLRYIEGWAQADAARIAEVVTVDYCFRDPLVGSFDAASLRRYFAILRRRVGFDSLHIPHRKVCLRAFATTQWPASRLRFCRSIPECGLSGISEVELSGGRVRREAVCYETNVATEWLRGATPDYATPAPAGPPAG